jgi:RecA/RadA recombinase
VNTLSRVARIYKVAVVITNQVQSIPSDPMRSFNDEIPTGGNILGHACTYRVSLKRSSFENVYVTIVKSPYGSQSYPYALCVISDRGIEDKSDGTYNNFE